jgi:hypothetical protein
MKARFTIPSGDTVAMPKAVLPSEPAPVPPPLILKNIALHVQRAGPELKPDRSRALLRPFHPSNVDIARRIVARVMAL